MVSTASLAGLGNVLTGYNQEYDQSLKQLGDIAFGRTLQMLSTGNLAYGQPPGQGGYGQQAPSYGQQIPIGSPPVAQNMPGGPQIPTVQQQPMTAAPRVATPPPTAPPMGGGPQMLPPQPFAAPQQGFPQPQGQQGPKLDWRTVFEKVQQANPGAPPQVLAAAVDRFLPLMNQQAQMEWKNIISPELVRERLGVTERGQDITAATRERGQDITSETARRGQDIRAETAQAGREEREREFDIREQRLSAATTIRQDQAWQRLDMQRRNLERQIKEGGQRQNIAQWRAILDAQHKRAIEVIQSYSAMNALDDKTRTQLLKDSNDAYEKAIKEIGGGGQPSP